MAAPSLIAPATIKNSKLPFSSMIDNICNIAPYALSYYRNFKRDGIRIVYLNNDRGCNLAAALGAKLAGIPFLLHARPAPAPTPEAIAGYCPTLAIALPSQMQ